MQPIDVVYLIAYTVMIYSAVLWYTVFFANKKGMNINPRVKNYPSVSFLIPSYNEEECIERCINSIKNLEYPKEKINITVIDDGSEDNTTEIVKKFKDVKLIKQKHSGKAVAINNGLKFVNTELVGCLDGDSFVDRRYLSRIVGHAEKEDVAAVTPSLKVVARNSLIQKIQYIEYLFSIFLRKIFAVFDCQYVVPGPGGIYKTDILKKVGGFDEKNITEDMEIAFRLIDSGYKLENSINAYVYTDTPTNFKGLFNQRIRWYRGYIQNARKYEHMIGNLKFGNMGFFLLPINFVWMAILGFLFFSLLINSVQRTVEFFIDWSLINYAIPQIKVSIDVFLLSFYTSFIVIFFLFSLLSIQLSLKCSNEKIELKKKLKDYIGFLFIYPFLISIFWIVSIFYEIFRVGKKW